MYDSDHLKSEVEESLRDKMLSINDMRQGDMDSAFSRLGAVYTPKVADALYLAQAKIRMSIESHINRAEWHIYLEVAADLEKAGL